MEVYSTRNTAEGLITILAYVVCSDVQVYQYSLRVHCSSTHEVREVGEREEVLSEEKSHQTTGRRQREERRGQGEKGAGTGGSRERRQQGEEG